MKPLHRDRQGREGSSGAAKVTQAMSGDPRPHLPKEEGLEREVPPKQDVCLPPATCIRSLLQLISYMLGSQ